MKTIYAHPGQALMLGRRGENDVRQIIFDLTAWRELYGAGVAQLIHQRAGDAAPYPAILLQTDAEAIWTLFDADTAIEGEGKAELQYLVGEQLAKSCTWITHTEQALGDATDAPPDPEKGWVDQVLQAGTTAQQAADFAAETAKKAEETASQLQSVDAEVKAAQDAAAAAAASEQNAGSAATRAEKAAQGVESTLAELEAAMAAI